MDLGKLSAKYESSGDAAAVSQDMNNYRGWSYGLYQFSSRLGVVQRFVRSLQQQEPPYDEYGRKLAAAGEPASCQGFVDTWVKIGRNDPGGFGDLQNAYAQAMYYDPGVGILRSAYGFDIAGHSEALKAVLFSNCVQHGVTYGAEVFKDGADLAGQALNGMSDYDIIYNIYEVKLTDSSWSGSNPDDRPGLYVRWQNERQDALNLLTYGTF